MKRLICLILCVLLLCPYVHAEKTAQTWLDEFLTENSLYDRIAVTYINLLNGESASYHGSELHMTGRVWEILLQMYYYEREAEGAFEVLPGQNTDPYDLNYYINGKTLETCRFESMVQGNAATAEQMRENLGPVLEYQALINRAYGGNLMVKDFGYSMKYPTDILCNGMRYLYAHSTKFMELVVNYQMASDNKGFGAMSGQYDILHVNDVEDGWYCDAAIIYGQTPYCVVGFFPEERGEELAAKLNEYIVAQFDVVEPETMPTTNLHIHDPEDLAIIAKDYTVDRDGKLRLMAITVGVGVSVMAVLLTALWLTFKILRQRAEEKWLQASEKIEAMEEDADDDDRPF